MAITIVGVRESQLAGNTNNMIKRSVWEEIYLYEPYRTPMLQRFWASRANQIAVGNPKFELQEDILVPRKVTVGAITDGAPTKNLIITEFNYLKIYDIIHNDITGENYYVTATPTTTTVAVAKAGSGNITASDAFTGTVIGTAFPEKGPAATAISTISTFPFNYTEIFKKGVNLSGTQMATVNYGGDDWANQFEKATMEIKEDLEQSAIKGIRHLIVATAGVPGRRFTGGLLDQTAGSVGITDASSYPGDVAPDESYFFKTYLKNLFAKGSSRKTLYCGIDLLLAIGEFSQIKQQTSIDDSMYGYDIRTIKTSAGGMLDLVWHPILDGEYSNWGLGVDPGYLKYVYLTNGKSARNLQIQRDLTIGTDEKLDQYLAEIGWHFAGGSQGVHRILKPSS